MLVEVADLGPDRRRVEGVSEKMLAQTLRKNFIENGTLRYTLTGIYYLIFVCHLFTLSLILQ